MIVRLGFAIAAHLEPEILVVDEVLAVGDAEFQKKAIGKMQDVSQGEGRTVLFVSHNMGAVQNLCNAGILLNQGRIETYGGIDTVINKYLEVNRIQMQKLADVKARKGNGKLKFTEGIVKDLKTNQFNQVESFSDIQIELIFETSELSKTSNTRIDIGINNNLGDRVAWISSESINHSINLSKRAISFIISNLPLAPGDYNCNLYCEVNNDPADWLSNVLPFTIIEKDYYKSGKTVIANQGNIILNYTIC